MPAYGVAQSGGNTNSALNLSSIVPGDNFTLLSGTETITSGYKSVAFSRGYSPGAHDNGTTFYISGCAAGSVVQIQGSNQNIDGTYFLLSTITPDAIGNGAYSDSGRAAFYRCEVSTYASPDVPVVIAQR